jgi:hypothetical protein
MGFWGIFWGFWVIFYPIVSCWALIFTIVSYASPIETLFFEGFKTGKHAGFA